MTDRTKTIELKRRAHKDTIQYLEQKKFACSLQLQRNRGKINSLANEQKVSKKMIFFLNNLIRLQEGKEPYTWNEKKRKVIQNTKSKNKVLSAFLVIVHYKDGSHKPLNVFDTQESANEYMMEDEIDTISEVDMILEKERPLAIKTHKARIILID